MYNINREVEVLLLTPHTHKHAERSTQGGKLHLFRRTRGEQGKVVFCEQRRKPQEAKNYAAYVPPIYY